jgi:phosphate transport system substrate-binding protein
LIDHQELSTSARSVGQVGASSWPRSCAGGLDVQTGFGFGSLARLGLYAAPVGLALLAGAHYFGEQVETVASQAGSVQVAGSETMRPVVTTCAEDFMTRNPQADVIVKGGGSGDGIAALLHGIVDIGMASRDLSRREREFAASQGISLAVTGLALDGVTIIVNRASAVAALDIGQLRGIFTGKVRNWRELGGGDAEIFAFARAPGSGTAAMFGDHVLGEEPYGASVRRLPTNEAIVAEVAALPGTIGYADLGATKGAGDRVKVVPLRIDPEQAPVAPTPDTVRSGDYPLARTLNLGTAGSPSGVAKAFIDFCSGASGQALLQRAGYVGMKLAAK